MDEEFKIRDILSREENQLAHENHTMAACIEACLACHRSCLSTVAHCLKLGGHHADAAHITLMMDCAQICVVCADFMLRGSAHAAHLCRECAEICRACEVSCRAHAQGDALMLACAEACRRCAEECDKMTA
jgi:hypothetical protein